MPSPQPFRESEDKMLRAFSVTFNVVAMLGLLLAGLIIHGQQRDWDVPLTWTLVLGGVWAAILVRVVVLLREAFAELRKEGQDGVALAGEKADRAQLL